MNESHPLRDTGFMAPMIAFVDPPLFASRAIAIASAVDAHSISSTAEGCQSGTTATIDVATGVSALAGHMESGNSP